MSAPTIEQVEQVVAECVRPVLHAEGGDLRVEKVAPDGTVSICFTGRCAGCPGAELTLSSLITPFLTARLPEVKKVVSMTWSLPAQDETSSTAGAPLETAGAAEEAEAGDEAASNDATGSTDQAEPDELAAGLEPTLEMAKVEDLDEAGETGEGTVETERDENKAGG